MSCIYGLRQMGAEDQGWIAHFLIRALKGEPITLYGNGCRVRHILDVSKAVESAYLKAWERIDRISGRAFNLGGVALLAEWLCESRGLSRADAPLQQDLVS